MLLSGCVSKQHRLWEQQQTFFEEDTKLFHAYLSADENQVRPILEQKIQLLEKDTSLSRDGWAQRISWEYSHLYVLEKRTGNQDSAEANLVKARYWFLRACELSDMPAQQKMDEFKRADANFIFAMVDKMDKALTDGKGPKYLQNLNGAKP
ncbi:MAG: hypothetical protein JWR19_1237 [Pedosphaera sp.]|nr:hypothetical protein [Pedosphaera sp.]